MIKNNKSSLGADAVLSIFAISTARFFAQFLMARGCLVTNSSFLIARSNFSCNCSDMIFSNFSGGMSIFLLRSDKNGIKFFLLL